MRVASKKTGHITFQSILLVAFLVRAIMAII